MKKVIWRVLLGTVLSIAAATGSVSAHHSHAMYESDKTIPVTGVVKAIRWVNPHSWLTVEAPDEKGNVVSYQIELAGLQQVRARGLTEAIKVGSRITLNIQPLRNGDPGGALTTITSINDVENADTSGGWKPK